MLPEIDQPSKCLMKFNPRWAAKEATIKAHRHRRLYMRDVSIVQSSQNGNVVALIDPICNTVEMNERVATVRGLRIPEFQRERLTKGAFEVQEGGDETAESQGAKCVTFYRRSKIEEFERQTAEISISHDGDYAVAVCMAIDSPKPSPTDTHIFDDGSGSPIHEPQWGDEGWLDTDDVFKSET